MLLKKNVLIGVTALTFCLAGIALGGAVRQELVSEEGLMVGQAILNYAKGVDMTICQVNCWDLVPEEEYIVLLCNWDEDGDLYICILDSFITNKTGIGYLYASIEDDLSDWCVVLGVEDSGGNVIPCGWWSIWPDGPPILDPPIHL